MHKFADLVVSYVTCKCLQAYFFVNLGNNSIWYESNV